MRGYPSQLQTDKKEEEEEEREYAGSNGWVFWGGFDLFPGRQ